MPDVGQKESFVDYLRRIGGIQDQPVFINPPGVPSVPNPSSPGAVNSAIPLDELERRAIEAAKNGLPTGNPKGKPKVYRKMEGAPFSSPTAGAAARSPMAQEDPSAYTTRGGGRGGDALLNAADDKKQKVIEEQTGGSGAADNVSDIILPAIPLGGGPAEDVKVVARDHPFGLSPKEEAFVKDNKDILLMAATPKPDVGPLLALIDTWTGSKLLPGYKSPGSMGEQGAMGAKAFADVLGAITERDYKKALTQQAEDKHHAQLIELARLEGFGFLPKGYTHQAALKAKADLDKAKAQNELSGAGLKQAQTVTLDATRDAAVKLKESMAGLNDARSVKVRREAEKVLTEMDKLEADIAKTNADTTGKRLGYDEIKARTERINADIQRLNEMTRGKKIEHDYQEKTGTKMPTPRTGTGTGTTPKSSSGRAISDKELDDMAMTYGKSVFLKEYPNERQPGRLLTEDQAAKVRTKMRQIIDKIDAKNPNLSPVQRRQLIDGAMEQLYGRQ